MAKKKKRFIGPTREAAKLGLASLGEQDDYIGVLNTPAPASYDEFRAGYGLGPLSQPSTIKFETPQPLSVSGEPLTENERQVREMASGHFKASAPVSPAEMQVRNMAIGYYMAFGRLPSADKMTMLMQQPIPNGTPEQYAALWKGGELNEALGAGDFFQDTGQEGLHGLDELISIVRERKLGVKDPMFTEGDNVTLDTVKEHIRYQRGFKVKRAPDITDAVSLGDERGQMLFYSQKLADRMRRRNLPVEWDVENPWGDKNFIDASMRYAMGRQFAFSLYGDGEDQTRANDIITYLLTQPVNKDQFELLAEDIPGVEKADWTDNTTVGTVLDAMRYADDERTHQIVFDNWMFGRPVGESPSQARWEFAKKFGANRLPAEERAKYEQSEATVMGALSQVTEEAAEIWEWAKDIPVVGKGLAAMGGLVVGTDKALKEIPVVGQLYGAAKYVALGDLVIDAMQGIVAVYDMANRADRGMTLEEYHKKLSETGGEFEDDYGWNWSIFLDTSAWAQAWEEAEGKTPITELLNTISYDMSGKEATWASSVGQLADFSAMMYVGAKGDWVIRGGAMAAKDAAFLAGRTTEKALTRGGRLATKLASETGAIETPGQTAMDDVAAVTPNKRTGKLPPKLTPEEFEKMRPPVQGLSYHGSPEGQLTKLDPWSSQSVPPGTYTTTGNLHAEAYARGATARLSPEQIREIAKERGIDGVDLVTGEWRHKVYDKSFGQGRVNYIEGVPRKTINLDKPLEERILSDIKEAAKRAFPETEYARYSWKDFDWDGMRGKTGQQVYDQLIDAISDSGVLNYDEFMALQGLNDQLGKFGYDAFTRTEGKRSSGFGQQVVIWMEHAIESDRAQVVPWEDAYQRYSAAYDRALAKHPEMAPAQATTAPDGVEVATVETPKGPVDVDANIADDLQRLNDGGYPTHQSHGGPKGHPKDHPTVKEGVEPYVEFAVRDLGEGKVRGAKLGQIKKAAESAGARWEMGKATIDGAEHSTISVHGDVKRFTDELMGREVPKRPVEAQGGPSGAISGGEAPPTPVEAPPVSNARKRWQAKFFRTNAEVMAAVDDPQFIGRIYDIPEEDIAAKRLVQKIAKTKDADEVERLLRQLEENGYEIDGGASAIAKNMRQAAYARGFETRNGFVRTFMTPLVFGRDHSVNGASDMMHQVGTTTKLGREGPVSADTAARVRSYTRRVYEADTPNAKQRVIDEFWDEFERNMGEAGMEAFRKFEARWYRAQSRSALGNAARRAYFGVTRNGRPVEGSKFTLTRMLAKRAKKELDDLGIDATPEERARIEKAFADAEKEVKKVEKAYKDIETLSAKQELSAAEAKRLTEAKRTVDGQSEIPVPFKFGQTRKHLTHRYNPRIAAWYQSGKLGRAWGLANEAVAEPLMRLFKETVMASLGFPVRVMAGDEGIRLIPEGTIARRRGKLLTRDPLKQLEDEYGALPGRMREEIRDPMAMDWAGADSGDWILATKDTHPRYYEYLRNDLYSWRGEPIVQRIIADNGGVFPSSIDDLRGLVAKMREDPAFDLQLREFLEDTYRSVGGKIDDAAYETWLGQWDDRLSVIAANPTMRRAMTEQVSLKDVKAIPDEFLYPVNAPEATVSAQRGGLYSLSVVNPYHYLYHGIPIGNGRRAGAAQLLGTMSNWLRETVFADRYYVERAKAIATAKKAGKVIDEAEVHTLAAERAMRHTNRVTYTKSVTLAEDMARNLRPFVSAYRQFWVYWLSAFAKHPMSMSIAMKEYPMQDIFHAVGDYQYIVPSMPFWAVQEEGEELNPLSMAKNQFPMAGFLETGAARTVYGLLGGDPNSIASLPMMEGADARKFAPFSRIARLTYGLTGDFMPGADTLIGESIWGDPDKLEKAHINAVIGQLSFDQDTGQVKRDKPLWWRALEEVLPENAKPEALFAEGAKTVLPTTLSYSPENVRVKSELLYGYYDEVSKGNTAKAAEMRSKSSFLDKLLSYYDANEEERLAMKRDPANKEMLKWWVSPYNYDKTGRPYDGWDWQTQFTKGKISYKTDEEFTTAFNNLYVDIHGGTYMQSSSRQGGMRYEGDVPRIEAAKRTKAKLKEALQWADKIAKYAAKTRGWDYDRLMWQFQHPEQNHGIWPELMRLNGKDPMQYNVSAILAAFSAKYGGDFSIRKDDKDIVKTFEARAESGLKTKPWEMYTSDALRALDLQRWIVKPELAEKFASETPFSKSLVKAKRDQKNAVMKAVVEMAGMENWYDLSPQHLALVGIEASEKINVLQNDLNAKYKAFKKLKFGTKEYKAARNDYYAARDKLFRSVKGGEVIVGGLADRLARIPYVVEAQVTTMGTGKGALKQQIAYDNFIRATDKVLAEQNPDPDRILQAYEKFAGNKTFAKKQQAEFLRVVAWRFLLANAKRSFHDARTHYSDHYEGPGESASSTYGKKLADELDVLVKRLRQFSPEFDRNVDDWFGKDAAVGYRLISFYDY
jgi:hypothetical protein